MNRGVVCVAAMTLAGCASVAPPLPPALNLPARVTDLSAIQRGSQIFIQFTMPKLTTEALAIPDPPDADLRIGPSGPKFDMREWLATSKPIPAPYTTSVEPYVGKDVVIALRLKNDHGKDAGWSNFVALSINAPVARPEGVKAQATARGVELSFTGSAPNYRIYRKTGASDYAPLGETRQSPYLDTTAEYGKHYTYMVIGVKTASESERSTEVSITPVDVFPPAVPADFKIIVGARSIELNWARDTEPDLAGYRVYRAEGDGPFQLIAGAVVSTSYSDRTAKPSIHYRYALSAFDQNGNESTHTAPIDAIMP